MREMVGPGPDVEPVLDVDLVPDMEQGLDVVTGHDKLSSSVAGLP